MKRIFSITLIAALLLCVCVPILTSGITEKACRHRPGSYRDYGHIKNMHRYGYICLDCGVEYRIVTISCSGGPIHNAPF